MLQKIKENSRNILIIVLIITMCIIIFFYQCKKVGFHEDEAHTLSSSVNPINGLMFAYGENEIPEWKTRDYVTDYVTLSPNNYFNLKSLYVNQALDNHPPFFYTLVRFSSILLGGKFSKYPVFIVNLIAFILSCFIIWAILKLFGKEHLTIPILLFYGLSMGTISMVIFQKMYMLLTLFILLYFYYSLKIYKDNFNLSRKTCITLGFITVLGFLTQYFFIFYAFFIFAFMIYKMVKNKQYTIVKKYIYLHLLYAIIGILLFVPCIKHLLFSDRGLSNLANSAYFTHLYDYLKHLAYAFSINSSSSILMFVILITFFVGIIYLLISNKNKFLVLITIIPSVLFFFITVKMTSFQELRYIMPVIPFISFTLFFILDDLFKFKYKNIVIILLSFLLTLNGLIFSKPKFLYENYSDCLQIAEDNKDKSFVYIYDNLFNHMQSIPEMMIYDKTLIINIAKGELKYVLEDENLNNEDSYILCIKNYLDNDSILEEIKNNSDFKNITKLYEIDKNLPSSDVVNNTLYFVSK